MMGDGINPIPAISGNEATSGNASLGGAPEVDATEPGREKKNASRAQLAAEREAPFVAYVPQASYTGRPDIPVKATAMPDQKALAVRPLGAVHRRVKPLGEEDNKGGRNPKNKKQQSERSQVATGPDSDHDLEALHHLHDPAAIEHFLKEAVARLGEAALMNVRVELREGRVGPGTGSLWVAALAHYDEVG